MVLSVTSGSISAQSEVTRTTTSAFASCAARKQRSSTSRSSPRETGTEHLRHSVTITSSTARSVVAIKTSLIKRVRRRRPITRQSMVWRPRSLSTLPSGCCGHAPEQWPRLSLPLYLDRRLPTSTAEQMGDEIPNRWDHRNFLCGSASTRMQTWPTVIFRLPVHQTTPWKWLRA
jgi:hypothetical protein